MVVIINTLWSSGVGRFSRVFRMKTMASKAPMCITSPRSLLTVIVGKSRPRSRSRDRYMWARQWPQATTIPTKSNRSTSKAPTRGCMQNRNCWRIIQCLDLKGKWQLERTDRIRNRERHNRKIGLIKSTSIKRKMLHPRCVNVLLRSLH